MGSFLTDNHQATKRNRYFEFILLILLVLQIVVMTIALVGLVNLPLQKKHEVRGFIGFLPFWVAGLIPILISRIKFPLTEAKRQLLLLPLILLALLLLLGITIFSWYSYQDVCKIIIVKSWAEAIACPNFSL